MSMRPSRTVRLRTLLPVLATLVVVGPLGWMWASSFVPSTYAATEMGYVDAGGAQPQRVGFPGIVPLIGGTSLPVRSLGPDLGEHTDEVLGALLGRVATREEISA